MPISINKFDMPKFVLALRCLVVPACGCVWIALKQRVSGGVI